MPTTTIRPARSQSRRAVRPRAATRVDSLTCESLASPRAAPQRQVERTPAETSGLKIPDRSWKPWVGGVAGVAGTGAIFGTYTGVASLWNPGIDAPWWTRGGSDAVFAGHPTWTGFGNMVNSVITTIASGVQIGGGIFSGTRSVAGLVHGARYRKALSARIRRAEAAQAGDAPSAELDALTYAQDAISKVRRDRALDVIPSAFDLVAGTVTVCSAGLAAAPAMGFGLTGLGMRMVKVGADLLVERKRRQRAERFADLTRREADAAANGAALSQDDASALQAMRRVRTLRARSRRGERLTWKERWTLAKAVNEDAATEVANARRERTADYILGAQGAEKAFMLGAVGLAEGQLDRWAAAAPAETDAAAFVRERLLKKMRRL